METVNDVVLADPAVYPDEAVLKAALGPAYGGYLALLDLFSRRGLAAEWRYYRDGKAWLCKVQLKARTIVWMSAWPGFLQATVYVPPKHAEALAGLALGSAAKARIASARKVGSSTPCIFEVRSASDLADLEVLVDFKIAAR